MFKNKIIQGDCFAVLKTLPTASVDLVVTSPPYYLQREYGNIGIGNETTETAYLDNLHNIFLECVRVVKPSGALVFNLGDKYIESGLSLLPYKFAIRATATKGVFLINNLSWEKLNPTPRQDKRKLVQSHEPFFIFAKTRDYTFNYADFLGHLDNSNGIKPKITEGLGKKYFELIDSSKLLPTEKEHARQELQKVILEVRNGNIEGFRMKIRGLHAPPFGGQEGGRKIQIDKNGFTIIRLKGEKMKRDIIESPVESLKNTQHPAVYPLFVVQELIKLLSNPNDFVLDPFCGSGTTCLAARNLGRDFIGIEINPDYVRFAEERLALQNQPTLELFV